MCGKGQLCLRCSNHSPGASARSCPFFAPVPFLHILGPVHRRPRLCRGGTNTTPHTSYGTQGRFCVALARFVTEARDPPTVIRPCGKHQQCTSTWTRFSSEDKRHLGGWRHGPHCARTNERNRNKRTKQCPSCMSIVPPPPFFFFFFLLCNQPQRMHSSAQTSIDEMKKKNIV